MRFTVILLSGLLLLLVACTDHDDTSARSTRARIHKQEIATHRITHCSLPINGRKTLKEIQLLDSVHAFCQRMEKYVGENCATMSVDSYPGRRFEQMPIWSEYTWPEDFSEYLVIGVSAYSNGHMYRWQSFFVRLSDGAIFVLKDATSGELIPIQEWREMGHWSGLVNIDERFKLPVPNS